MTRAGLPAMMLLGGNVPDTTAPAPTTQPASSIVPLKMNAPEPINTSSLMITGLLAAPLLRSMRRAAAERG